MKSMSKLRGLISLKKKSHETDLEDVKEFMRVADIVTGFLESPITNDQIADALEYRRTSGISRVIGLLAISRLLNFSSSKHETFIVKSFVNSFKEGEKKLYYSNGLEGTDPKLLESVQKAFFIVFKSLQTDLISQHYAEFSYETYTHFSNVIEGLSCPLKNLDTHLLLDQPLSATLKVLLDWSKGSIKEKPQKRKLNTENLVTRFALLTEDAIPEGKAKILIEKREEQPSLYLTFDKGGKELPITDFIISEEEKLEYEDAVGEFTHNSIKKRIYIKRSEESPSLLYLTGLSEDFTPAYTLHTDLLEPINEEEKKKMNALKENLCKKSWNLYKQLLYSILGAWVESNQTQQLEVQNLFLRVIFPEISTDIKDQTVQNFNLKAFSTGEDWVGKSLVVDERPTNMQAWVQKFSLEKPPHWLQDIVQGYIANIDNLETGKVHAEFSLENQEKLKDSKNEAGEYDFFKFLENIKLSTTLPEQVKEYVQTNKL